MTTHIFNIAGVQHHQYKECLSDLSEGMIFTLVPEPTNKYDPNAIKIVHTTEYANEYDEDIEVSFMLGYVPAKIASSILAMMEIYDSVTCTLTSLNPTAKPWEMMEVTISGNNE